jgi:hypothetical protein
MTPPVLITPEPAPPSPLRATALVAFLVFLLGTTFYGLGTEVWSGRRVATYEVPAGTRAPLRTNPLHMGAPYARRLGPVHLTPGMSPARALVHVRFRPRMMGHMRCSVQMKNDRGKVVWAGDGRFGGPGRGQMPRGESVAALNLGTLDVPEAGDYTFTVEFRDVSSGRVSTASLEVRRNVAEVQLWFVAVGAFLALGSLAAALLIAPAGDPLPRRSAAA